MKEGWTYKKLGEVATFARGLTYSKKDEVESSKNIVLRSNNIDLLSGKLDFSELKYLDENFKIPADKRVKQGSLFICMSNGSKAHLGKVAYIDKNYNYAFGGFMGQITPTNDVDGLYLHYALSSPLYKDYIKSLSEGANINNLKFKDLSGFVIGYPPLLEQRSIVIRLDAAFAHIDALKANAERQLAEARALFNRALTEEMTPKEGWEEKTLGNITTSMADGPFGSNLKKEHYTANKEVRIIQLSNIGEEGWREENTKYTTFEHLKTIQRSEVLPGDIVIAKMMPAGRAILCPDKEKKYVLSSDAVRATLKDGLDNRFVLFSINSDYFRKQVYANVSGSGRVRTSLTKLRDCKLYLPSVKEQHSIVSRLDALSANVRQLEEVQRKTLVECDALKQAMLREVFE